jgi:hypothetical protein
MTASIFLHFSFQSAAAIVDFLGKTSGIAASELALPQVILNQGLWK